MRAASRLFCLLLLASCPFQAWADTESARFGPPAKVQIHGLPTGWGGTPLSTEEPFLSRDDRYLFFNSAKQEGKKDLHWAEMVNGRFHYRGQLGPQINTPDEVQGNPTMDRSGRFYFIESSTDSMVKSGQFDPEKGAVFGIRDFEGVPSREIKLFKQRLHGNMGVEVSADGSYMFFSRAVFKLIIIKFHRIKESDLHFVRKKKRKFVFDEQESNRIMQNINTDDLEYAASISVDGLELFFTRMAAEDLESGTIRSQIMRSTRPALDAPFTKPELIRSIGSADFVEGPSISSDGSVLYYHKREADKFRLYKVNRLSSAPGR